MSSLQSRVAVLERRETPEVNLAFIQVFCLFAFPRHGTKEWSLKSKDLVGHRKQRSQYGKAGVFRICREVSQGRVFLCTEKEL